ncbi:MAG: helix-turn-helix transcriptional regulator [Eubacteriales bacterium]|nr:helix-turn-helix transcriptional regulator [Eubacteriales bacterium]
MDTRICELRLQFGLTQQKLAAQINVSQETISAYERQEIVPSIQVLILLARFFHVSTDYLLKLSDTPSPDFPEFLTDSEQAWLTLYRRMGESARLRAFSYSEGLLATLDQCGRIEAPHLPLSLSVQESKFGKGTTPRVDRSGR